MGDLDRKLLAMIRGLLPRERKALAHFWFDDATIDQVRRACGLKTTAAARSLLARAGQKLQKRGSSLGVKSKKRKTRRTRVKLKRCAKLFGE